MLCVAGLLQDGGAHQEHRSSAKDHGESNCRVRQYGRYRSHRCYEIIEVSFIFCTCHKDLIIKLSIIYILLFKVWQRKEEARGFSKVHGKSCHENTHYEHLLHDTHCTHLRLCSVLRRENTESADRQVISCI